MHACMHELSNINGIIGGYAHLYHPKYRKYSRRRCTYCQPYDRVTIEIIKNGRARPVSVWNTLGQMRNRLFIAIFLAPGFLVL